MTDDHDPYTLPPEAKCYWGTNVERFATIDDEHGDPKEFFIRDDTGKWHCVDDCDYYAASVWHRHGAELTISEVGELKDHLSVRIRDLPDGPKFSLMPITWPEERREFECGGEPAA